MHEVRRGVAPVDEEVTAAPEVRNWSLSREEVRGRLSQVARQEHQLEAPRLHLMRASVDGTTQPPPGG